MQGILIHGEFERLGVPFHDVVMFMLVPDFLFKSILAHCVLDYLLSYQYLKILSLFSEFGGFQDVPI